MYPSLIQNQLLLCDDKVTDPEDVRTEKKIELITLHLAMKRLDLDYSAVVDPLLADQGPVLAHILRYMKTIQRLGKIKEDYLLQREQQRAAPPAAPAESAVAAQIRIDVRHEDNPLAVHSHESRTRRRCGRADKNCSFVPPEVLPRWGELRRYTNAINQSTYNEVVSATK